MHLYPQLSPTPLIIANWLLDRTNKLVDVCYSFWTGAVFPMLDFAIRYRQNRVARSRCWCFDLVYWLQESARRFAARNQIHVIRAQNPRCLSTVSVVSLFSLRMTPLTFATMQVELVVQRESDARVHFDCCARRMRSLLLSFSFSVSPPSHRCSFIVLDQTRRCPR